MAMRDGTVPDPQYASMRRYVEAQQLYFAKSAPHWPCPRLVDTGYAAF
jgi:hypothetical protein